MGERQRLTKALLPRKTALQLTAAVEKETSRTSEQKIQVLYWAGYVVGGGITLCAIPVSGAANDKIDRRIGES
jgi:hypothetical protein